MFCKIAIFYLFPKSLELTMHEFIVFVGKGVGTRHAAALN